MFVMFSMRTDNSSSLVFHMTYEGDDFKTWAYLLVAQIVLGINEHSLQSVVSILLF